MKSLTTKQLSLRWGVSVHTLKKWRITSRGPCFFKIGKKINSKVFYKIKDIKNWEKK